MTLNNKELKYKYESKWGLIVMLFAIFGAGSTLFYYKARTNDIGLIINGIIELDTESANIFFWVLFALSFSFVLFGVYLAFQKLSKTIYVVLDLEKIYVPGLLFKKESTVYFKDIELITEQQVQNNLILQIKHKNGKTNIVRNLLPSNDNYAELKKVISTAIS